MTVPFSRTAAAAGPALAAPPAASYAALYRQMWAHAAGARARLVLAFTLLVGSQLVKLVVPWLAAQAIDTLQRGSVAGVTIIHAEGPAAANGPRADEALPEQLAGAA